MTAAASMLINGVVAEAPLELLGDDVIELL